MELMLITAQGGSFDEYYEDCVEPHIHPSWIEPIKRVRKLFNHLEQNVDGPPQWITISHLIWFYMSDEDNWQPQKARVFVEPRHYGYQIKYRSARELDWDKSFTVLEAHSVEEAGEIIIKALQLAEKNLPGIGES